MADSMLQLYRLYSESISAAIVAGGPHTARSSFVKYMRRCGVGRVRRLRCGCAAAALRLRCGCVGRGGGVHARLFPCWQQDAG
jgi:hypothetical protein